ncbi:MAG: hypothetical protein Ta2A_26250 [Treponemataceae bacterium]|nr:MAG: hypothetical protein Ta2A_26250 [Treponemataceae bacterium]
MNNTFLLYAKYIQDKDTKIAALLDTLSNEEREKDRGSYYKSLSGLYQHLGGAMTFFLDYLKKALPEGSAAKALPAPAATYPEGSLTEADWQKVKTLVAGANQAYVDFVTALTDAELDVSMKWFTGETVPLSFMLNSLIPHQVHHQGAIAQILDELKVNNDFSGIAVQFLVK